MLNPHDMIGLGSDGFPHAEITIGSFSLLPIKNPAS